MKLPWGELALVVGSALVARWSLGRGGDLPEPNVREKFMPQPVPVYLERIIWQLTRDHDLRKIRAMRNLLNDRYADIEECYRYQLPPNEVARRIEGMLRGETTTFVPAPEPTPAEGGAIPEGLETAT